MDFLAHFSCKHSVIFNKITGCVLCIGVSHTRVNTAVASQCAIVPDVARNKPRLAYLMMAITLASGWININMKQP